MEWPFTGRETEHQRALAALTDDDRAGVVVTGPAYVGRTRFLREVASSVSRTPKLTLAVTRSGREIRFGGLGELAPPDHGRPDTWVEHLRDRIPAGSVVVVDDAQWLDEHSALALHQLALSGHVRLLGALRDGHGVPGAVSQLWRDDHVLRVDLGPLDRGGVETLLERALGGPVAAETRRDLWSVTRGFPRLLREMAEDALEREVLIQDDGVWVLVAPVAAARRTVDAVNELLAEWGPEIERAIQLIAVGEPLDARVLDELVDSATTERIEHAGMVELDPSNDRYSFVAPGACMAIHAGLVPSRVRERCRELARVAGQDLTGLDGGDLLRHVRWHLEAGSPPAARDLLRAAAVATAQFDHITAERMARAALEEGGAEAHIRLATALTAQGRPSEAEEALGRAVEIATSSEQRIQATLERARLLTFALGRNHASIASLQKALAELEGSAEEGDVRTMLAFLLSLEGDLDAAVGHTESLVADTSAPAAVRAMAGMTLTFALGMRGDLEKALATCDALDELPMSEVETVQPLARPLLRMTRMMCHLYLGQLSPAWDIGREAYDQSLASDADEIAGVWATQLAGADLYCGQVERAAIRAGEARRLLQNADAIGALPLACAQGVLASAESGDRDMAAVWLQRLVEGRRLTDARTQILEGRARAALASCRGELAQAAQQARDTGRLANELGHRTWALLTLHQAVRYGYPEDVVATIVDTGDLVDGPFAAAMVQHAVALRAEDHDGLARVSVSFAELGLLLYAAEAAAQAARIASRTLDASRASSLRARARALAARCPGAQTPALAGLEGEPLTRREREIALLAARGDTSRSIAEDLFLSTRTVDNHLASVYRKLGVAGRDELPSALAVDAS